MARFNDIISTNISCILPTDVVCVYGGGGCHGHNKFAIVLHIRVRRFTKWNVRIQQRIPALLSPWRFVEGRWTKGCFTIDLI